MSSWGSANHDAITMQQRTKEPEENLWNRCPNTGGSRCF